MLNLFDPDQFRDPQPVFIAADPLQTERSTWETELLKAIRDAADDYARQTTAEDRNQELHKIIGVQEVARRDPRSSCRVKLIGHQ